MTIATTGTAGSGKSTFSKKLSESLEAQLLSSDQLAHELLANDPDTRDEMRQVFGAEFFSHDGSINRAALAARVFQDDKARLRLETILHPRIRSRWTAAGKVSAERGEYLVVEIPLLFEVGAERETDLNIAVLASGEIANRRLEERGWGPERIRRVRSLQWPARRKAERADVVVWNDGSPNLLSRHVHEVTERVRTHRLS